MLWTNLPIQRAQERLCSMRAVVALKEGMRLLLEADEAEANSLLGAMAMLLAQVVRHRHGISQA